ncbi:hypothetical protein EDD85DRAFT_867974 [Armillaria nabsnona]|nr:hypothetical protein EDD85DRAFT_867974 [Armillaria nabsnona]
MGGAPVSEASGISHECSVTSQPDMTTVTHGAHNALPSPTLLSSITSDENTTCNNISSRSIDKEIIACCMSTIRPRCCPPGYRKRFFLSEMTERLIRDYNIPSHHVYYYWRDEDRDDHTCPLDCGRRFVGESIKVHLENFHPNINSRSRKDICCSTQSHSKSKCPPQNVVQERYFLKHFTVMHSLAHSLCPFCLGRQTRVDHLYRHFAVCKVLRPKN